jgi:hypothetical protein
MNILYIFVEIIKKSTTMKNLIATLILNVLTLVGFSQSLLISADTSYSFTYPKNENLDSLLHYELLWSTGIDTNKVIYNFDLRGGELIQVSENTPTKRYPIVEISSYLTDDDLIVCKIKCQNGDIVDVEVNVDYETNLVELIFTYDGNDGLTRNGFIHQHGRYTFH